MASSAPGALDEVQGWHGGRTRWARTRAHSRSERFENRGRGNLRQGDRFPRPQRSPRRPVSRSSATTTRRASTSTTMLSKKYEDMLGVQRRQGLGHCQGSRHEADGRQYRLRPEETRGHGPASTTPSWSSPPITVPRPFKPSPTAASHPSRARRADAVGRRLLRGSVRRPLAGTHQAGHGLQRTNCSRPSTGCRRCRRDRRRSLKAHAI